MAVFSKTSRQLDRIEPRNPRTIFFSDSVAVAWMRGGFVELASIDPEQGVIFYELEQQRRDKPQFVRHDDCLSCHQSDVTLGVPGMMIRSLFTGPDGSPQLIFGGYTTDHSSPLKERWGGWYVTGKLGSNRHMGNTMITDSETPESTISSKAPDMGSLQERFETDGYLAPYSDVAALLVFNHQMHMMNLLTRIAWENRLYENTAALTELIGKTANEVVDYLLFVDETPLDGKSRARPGSLRSSPRSGRMTARAEHCVNSI